jgi:hypothetical protein
MTGTFASRAFFTSAAIFGTDATQVGRGGQMTDVMSRTRRAAPFTGTSTATGSGIFGIGDVGAAVGTGVTLAGAAVGDGLGDGAAAGAVQAETSASAATSAIK